MIRSLLTSIGLLATLASCSDADPAAQGAPRPLPPNTPLYDDDSKWTCRPGMNPNPCAGELTLTDIHPDRTTAEAPLEPTPASVSADCFYIYSTVDPGLDGPPRNLDFDRIDRPAVLGVLFSQAMPFRRMCNLYAPVYRQASLTSFYLLPEAEREAALETAYEDVAGAFENYVRAAGSERPLVLLSHSQGAMMMIRLIERRIKTDPQLMKRLVVVVLGGPLGGFSVPRGERIGGSFDRIPLCSSETETGCALTFNAFSTEGPPGPNYGAIGAHVGPGQDPGCTNPAAPGGGKARLAGAVFPLGRGQGEFAIAPDLGGLQVDSDFVRYAGFFTAECATSVGGLSYLRIAAEPAAGDARVNPLAFSSPLFADPSIGLHSVEYPLVMTDLEARVAAKIRAHAEGSR